MVRAEGAEDEPGASILSPGDRILIEDEPGLPIAERRRGWLLRLQGDSSWLVHMEEVHAETVPANRIHPDLEPRTSLHPVDAFFDAHVGPLLQHERGTPDEELTIRCIELHTTPLKRVFVLDTSALRAASPQDLESLQRRGLVLGFSSYSAWELISHLEGRYRLVRGNLLKARRLKLLDDPHKMFLAGARLREPKEIEDSDTLARLLPILEAHHDWPSFERGCADAGLPELARLDAAVREVFDLGEEQRHREYIRALLASLRETKWDLDDDQTALFAMNQYVDQNIQEARARGARQAGLRERMLPAAFPRAAYLIERGRQYLATGAQPDGNDFVDAAICWHLHLHFPRTLVTQDHDFGDALSSGLDRLRRIDVGFLTRVVKWPIPEATIVDALEDERAVVEQLGEALRQAGHDLPPGRDAGPP
ncbi:MAG: hypothetical protein IT384_18895 [Deltaproteobacteria bacterium]|nr:hypothetical protein [Deltaproteobacteria bacterium]